jgi:GNAT superfamily N-acetyltransferase
VKVRLAQPGDDAALERLHGHAGSDYAALSPPELRHRDGADVMRLVADVDGELAGALVAHLVAPDHGPGMLLRIDSLVTAETHRGRGYAARLVEAAEAWGRERGATVAETWTHDRDRVPFWKGRLAYAEEAVALRKPLA